MLKNLNKDYRIRKKWYLAFCVIDAENEMDKMSADICLKNEDYVEVLHERGRLCGGFI